MTIREAVAVFGRPPLPGEPKINVAKEIYAKMGSTSIKLPSVVVEYGRWLRGTDSAKVRRENRAKASMPVRRKKSMAFPTRVSRTSVARVQELFNRKRELDLTYDVITGVLQGLQQVIESELRTLVPKK